MSNIQHDTGQALLITGDISDGNQVSKDLMWLAAEYNGPLTLYLAIMTTTIEITEVNTEIAQLCTQISNLIWLDIQGPIALSSTTTLIGHTGWGDAQNGDFMSTPIRINDHRLIEDLSNLSRKELQTVLQQRGQTAAEHIERTFTSIDQSTNNGHHRNTCTTLSRVCLVLKICWCI